MAKAPYKSESEKKLQPVTFYVTYEEFDRLNAKAKAEGMSRSAYICKKTIYDKEN